MLDPSQRFTRSGWYLHPGPLTPTTEPIHTVAFHGLTEYDYPVVADAILAIPGTRCIHPPQPQWDNWVARWELTGRYIEVDMFPDTEHYFSDSSGRFFWSGGWLRCDCTVSDLADFLRAVRERCPGVWLCDSGDHLERGGSRLHTPETFLAMPTLPTG
jgi:hypothetical protein